MPFPVAPRDPVPPPMTWPPNGPERPILDIVATNLDTRLLIASLNPLGSRGIRADTIAGDQDVVCMADSCRRRIRHGHRRHYIPAAFPKCSGFFLRLFGSGSKVV